MLQGQSIILSGVAAAGASQATNQMTAGDAAAAQIRDMVGCFMAEAVNTVVGGGITGFDPANSGVLVPSGASAASMVRNDNDAQFAGHASVTMVQGSAIDLPAGTAEGIGSYTAVLVLSQTAASVAATPLVRFISLIGPDGNPIAYTLQRAGAAAGSPGMYLSPYSIATFDRYYASSAGTLPDGDVAAIYVLDWSNEEKLVRLAINTPTVRDQSTLPNKFTSPTPTGSYWRFGWPSGSNSLIGRLARAYVFPRSLMSSTTGLSQLSQLMSALRATYSIAS